MSEQTPNLKLAELRQRIHQQTYRDEPKLVSELLQADERSESQIAQAQDLAAELITRSRAHREDRSLLDAFLDQFGLTTQEGVALMCLAESVIRIPDAATADALIADKLGSHQWQDHLGASDSLLVNASTWGLMLSGQVIELGTPIERNFGNWFGQLINKMGEPVIRQSLKAAMRLLGDEFVFATTAQEAVSKATDGLFSFDMLGEGARTPEDAERYFDAYAHAINALASLKPTTADDKPNCYQTSGISVKLSALYPRYVQMHADAVHKRLYPKLLKLCEQAAALNIQLTIDAEEANRLDLSLGLIQRLAEEQVLKDWQGLGLALQAYGKRALPVIDWLAELSRAAGRRFIIRLVKGAYWDAEIKHSQMQGTESYPVFTTKSATDLSYMAAAQRLLANQKAFFPQFATHNAYTVANVLILGSDKEYELQRLHGMGELLYKQTTALIPNLPNVRTYAPVGPHKHLMAYLIRRLLENGANSSFVNRFLDDEVPVNELIVSSRKLVISRKSQIPLPADIYGNYRRNSQGFDLQDPHDLATLDEGIDQFEFHRWQFGSQPDQQVYNPARLDDLVGNCAPTSATDTETAITKATRAVPGWQQTPAAIRADIVESIGDVIEKNRHELIALLMREAGKTRDDGLDEIREAADFCYYYAQQARDHLQKAVELPSPTGETNHLSLHARGLFLCISPWNFPLAIFVGQVTAALCAGNCVIAKPAEQTPLIALRLAELISNTELPDGCLQLVIGDGKAGAQLVANPAMDGVVFTGSTHTANLIAQSLANRGGPIVPLIAETGGQNAMIADSTAMLEQVVDDVVRSAFGSAGQRCSALRLLCVQEDIADDLETMLTGAMSTLIVGDPWQRQTDVGPIIDAQALETLTQYCAAGAQSSDADKGYFFEPVLLKLNSVQEIGEEKFGPICHLVRFNADELDTVLDELAATNYGLTLGIHSRNNQFIEQVTNKTLAGNVYVNRNMIGAVVGVQPFGGRGLSGTGPKAGGPHYLNRFCVERTVTNNTAAVGGNLELLTRSASTDPQN